MNTELFTKIILRNDSTVNWLANESVVLLRGEVGIEFFADGRAKMKIGDGVSTWAQLPYFGGEVIGDKKSIDIIDGVLQILGFETAEVGAQLVKGVDGSAAWVLPDTTTVEGLSTAIETLRTDVTLLQTVVGSAATESAPATGLFAILEEKVNKNDVYTKPEIDSLLGSVYHYRGSKASYADLPVEGQVIGDVWNIETADTEHGIAAGDNVVWNGTTWDKLAGTVDLRGYITRDEFNDVKSVVDNIPLIYMTTETAQATLKSIKYEIVNIPEKTLVNYRDKEIRIMCDPNTEWKQQNVGDTGNSSYYYIALKAYAPSNDVVSFKEDMKYPIADDTMHYFEGNSFAGIDAYGRKYSISWLAVARHDSTTNTWEYLGEKSSNARYIGWNYSVEWYNAEGIKVDTDTIRINLSNESCHNTIEPSYMGTVVKNIKVNGTLLDTVDNTVDIEIPVIKSSADMNKVSVAEDGTMEVNNLNVNKLVQTENEYLILNGGSSTSVI